MPTATQKATIIQSFGVQADHPRSSDLIIQSIPGCRLRSTLSANKPGVRIPSDQARLFAILPVVPGMELHINPAKLSYVVNDPLYDDEDTCDRIRQAVNQLRGVKIEKINGAAPLKGKLDVHRMKTLCREMIWWHDEDAVKVVKGIMPTLEDVEQLPGNFMLNPGSQVMNSQPTFEKDFSAWYEQLTRSGG